VHLAGNDGHQLKRLLHYRAVPSCAQCLLSV